MKHAGGTNCVWVEEKKKTLHIEKPLRACMWLLKNKSLWVNWVLQRLFQGLFS